MHSYTVGIEIGSAKINIIQVDKKANSTEVVRFLCYRLTAGEDISSAIKRILNKNRIRGDLTVAGISSQKAMFRSISLPFRDINKIHKVVKFEVESSLPHPVEETVLALQARNGKDAESSDLFIGAVKKEAVASCCQILNAAGIDPHLVLLDCTALYNLYLHAFPACQEVIALVDIDEERILMVVAQGEHLLFSRSISNPVKPWPDYTQPDCTQKEGDGAGEQNSGKSAKEVIDSGQLASEEQDSGQFASEERDSGQFANPDVRPGCPISGVVSDGGVKLSKEDMDLILEEIDLTLYAFSSQYNRMDDQVSRIVLMGKSADCERISDYFTEKLGIETSIFDPLKAAGAENVSFQDQPLSSSLAVPLGLVLGGKKDKRSKFNLRQEELAYQKKYSQFKEMSIVLTVLAIMTISLLTLNIHYKTTVQQKKLNQTNQEIYQIYKEIFPGAKAGNNELLQARKAMDAEKEKYRIYKMFAHKSLTHLEILKDLSVQVPDEIKVEFIDLTIDKNQVKIKGIADSFEAIDRIKNRLQKTRPYAQTVVESAKVSGAENKVDFRLNITVSDS
jgi:Tfp pilus assembly PilM family ATPase/Tfp pilus assembly protein PilN